MQEPFICFRNPQTLGIMRCLVYSPILMKNTPDEPEGLLEFKFDEEGGIPIEEVESVDEFCGTLNKVPYLLSSISQKLMRHFSCTMNMIPANPIPVKVVSLERLTIGSDGLNRCSAPGV